MQENFTEEQREGVENDTGFIRAAQGANRSQENSGTKPANLGPGAGA